MDCRNFDKEEEDCIFDIIFFYLCIIHGSYVEIH